MRTGIRIALALLACSLPGARAAADMLSALLPTGVPGYGTDPGVTVTSRLRPETQPQGVRAGLLVLHPQLDEAFGYDSAPFGTTTRGSAVLQTRPSLLLNTDWSRHALGAYLAADDRRYLGAAAQNRTDWSLSLGGGVDIGRDRLTVSVAHLLQHQDRWQIGALATDRPVAFQLDDARAGYTLAGGRWTLTPQVEITSWRFSATTLDGAPLDQAYRDRTVLQGGVTLDYQLAPRRDVMLVTRAVGQHYRHNAVDQPGRDSTGYQALLGYADDDGGMWRYSLLAGIESRQFAALSSRTAAVGEAAVAWNVTGLTTLSASLSRSIEDAAQEGVAGFTYTSARLAVDHEYRRDVLLHASAGLQRADYLQGGGQQNGYALGAGITWLMNRHVHVSASWDLSTQHGGGLAGYTRQLGLLSLRLGL